MKISYKQDDTHEPDTVTITCSKAEVAALKYYAEYFAADHQRAADHAAARVPGDSSLFNFSIEFQDKLFR